MAFRIRIKPEIRFPPQMVASESRDGPSDDKFPPQRKMRMNLLSSADEIDACKRDLPVRDRQRSAKGGASPRHSTEPQPAPWHLLATLRLDGRQEFEKRSIIYLDDSHPDSHIRRDEIIMKCRTVKDADGRLRDCGWLFKEVGIVLQIDSVFDKLKLLSGNHDNEVVPTQEDDDLLTALRGLGANLEDAEERSTAGQIEVTLERVTVGRIKYDFWEGHGGESIDVDMSASDMNNISHTVARDKGTRKEDVIRFIFYDLVDPAEQPYATFRFYYRSEGEFLKISYHAYVLTWCTDKLRKFNFPGFAPKTPAASGLRQRKQALAKAAATPLSIINSKPVRYFSNDKGEIIREEDVPVIDLTKPKEPADETSSNGRPWVLKHNKFPTITIRDDPPGDLLDSPPDSPARDDETEDTATLDTRGKDFIAAPHLTPNDAEQSSADESSPLKQISEKAKNEAMTKFRMINDETTEGEEADDEASDGGRTPNSMSFRDDTGNAVGDEVDKISRDEPDGGISAELDKVMIGSKRISKDEGADEGAGIMSTSKKPRVANPLSEDQEVGKNNDEEL